MDGLNLEQWRTLDLLADGDGHSMTEIAGHVMVPAPTLTKIVDRLVESALVYRRPDERDRRRILVFLSDRGRGAAPQAGPGGAAGSRHELAGHARPGRARTCWRCCTGWPPDGAGPAQRCGPRAGRAAARG